MCIITGGMEKVTDNPIDGPQPLLTNAPLCLARTRAGTPCRCPAMKGKARCRIHGGAKGTGAPKGERIGMWRHGGDTQEAVALWKAAIQVIRALKNARG